MRLFFALWPPIEAIERLGAIARSVAAQSGGRPTRQETIHLTLAFLGEVDAEQLPLLIASAQGVRAAPYTLDIDCLGYWQHNQLIWAGSTVVCPALSELAYGLQSALGEAGFAHDGRKRAFFPHISLIRKRPETCAPLALPAITPISWQCSGFALIRSQTSDAGSAYETLSAFTLDQA